MHKSSGTQRENRSFSEYPRYSPEASDNRRYILLHRTRPKWLKVNRSGLAVANWLDEAKPRKWIERQLVSVHGISERRAAADVSYVVETLKHNGFLGEDVPKPERVPRLKSAYLHITSKCNLSCPQCYTRRSIPESCPHH